MSIFFKTVEAGAQTQIRLAVDPELENVTGKYFRDCKQITPSSAARDDETAKWLWQQSEELTQMVAVWKEMDFFSFVKFCGNLT